MNSDEAREMVKGNPYSFLHVDKAEVDLPVGTGKNNWSAFDRWGEQDGYVYLVRIDNNVVLMDKSRLTPDELKELERLLENVKK